MVICLFQFNFILLVQGVRNFDALERGDGGQGVLVSINLNDEVWLGGSKNVSYSAAACATNL